MSKHDTNFLSRIKGRFRSPKSSSQATNDRSKSSSTAERTQGPDTGATSKRDNYGFLELAAGTDPIVDIIAIHGLDGHREKTWMAKNGILWLRDLLPADLPNARVLAYGYDVDTRSRECVSTQTIYGHAEKFIQELSRERESVPQRPILFAAHSLGGIILKQALVICHAHSSESRTQFHDILVSTHGILFFGTPHSGTSGVALLQIVNRLLSVYMKTTTIILQNLKESSSELENLQKQYLLASDKVNTVCFYEEYATPVVGGRQEMIVPRQAATLTGDRQAIQEGLRADHCQMVKFSNRSQNDYQCVLKYLNDWMREAGSFVEKKWAIEDAVRATKSGALASPPEINLPKPLPAMSRSYIERPEIQSQITKLLLTVSPRRHQARCILHGMGGAGKTQLAMNFIKQHGKSFKKVLVVDVTSKTQLEADLQRAIRCVGPQYIEATWADAVAYLDNVETDWLLFLDNADSPDLNLNPYLPNSPSGAILITTRNQDCKEYAPDGTIHVDGLAESEAVDLLHKVANVAPTSNDVSLEIVRELGTLALAVTQAGAYISKTRQLNSYLATLQNHRYSLMHEDPFKGTNYAYSTYAAFDLSFHQLPCKAQELLKICAYFHHTGIPKALFERSAGSGFTARIILKGCPSPESDIAIISDLKEIIGSTWDDFSFQTLINAAQRASFINVLTDESESIFYSVHPLLQRYITDSLGDSTGQYGRMASQILLGATSRSEETNFWYWQLLPHIDSLPWSVKTDNIAHALAFNKVYKSLGIWKGSRKLLEFAFATLKDMQDHRHDDILWIMAGIADVARRDGQLEEAEQLGQEALNMYTERCGKRDPNTVIAMSYLATTLHNRGQRDEAERLWRKVLDMSTEIHGRHHPGTVAAMGNLGATLHVRGQLDKAEKLEREVLAMDIELHGRRHPDTVTSMANLAATLHDRRQLEEAENLRREVVDLRIELLGRHHPNTVRAMKKLVHTLKTRGKLDEAAVLDREIST